MRILILLLLPSIALAQVIQGNPSPAFRSPGGAIGGALSPVVLSANFGMQGCFASGTSFGKAAAVSITRASSATYVSGGGVLLTCAANQLRIGPSGAVVEPLGSNLALWSGDLSNASWGLTFTGPVVAPVVTANAGVAPDATMTAARVDFAAISASAQRSIMYQTITTTAQSATASISVRTVSGTGALYLAPATGTVWTACPVTTTWSRCSVSFTAGAGVSYLQIGPDATGTSTQPIAQPALSVYLAAAQMEYGPLTSYIATTTAPVTRAADVPTVTAPANAIWRIWTVGGVPASASVVGGSTVTLPAGNVSRLVLCRKNSAACR